MSFQTVILCVKGMFECYTCLKVRSYKVHSQCNGTFLFLCKYLFIQTMLWCEILRFSLCVLTCICVCRSLMSYCLIDVLQFSPFQSMTDSIVTKSGSQMFDFVFLANPNLLVFLLVMLAALCIQCLGFTLTFFWSICNIICNWFFCCFKS